MLSLIIPPIVLIVSVMLLVLFVFRKIKSIPDPTEHDLVHVSAISNYVKSINISRVQHFSLATLEKTAQRFKVLSLRFHNYVDQWFQSLKKKRQKNRELMEKHKELSEEHRSRIGVTTQKEEAKSRVAVSFEEKNISAANASVKASTTSNIIRKNSAPIISRVTTIPRQEDPQIEARKKFEELLIDRIATDPRDIEAYERLGDYYIEQRNHVDAKECYKQVLRLSPINRKARLRMRNIERELSK